MRSRLIFSLGSVILLCAGSASAETARVRVSIEELPFVKDPVVIKGAEAVLPNGARDRGPVPKTWREPTPGEEQVDEASRCTDDRRGSVGTIYGHTASTARIWEANGKIWLDNADVDTALGVIEVKRAERVPLARVADGIFAYRRDKHVVLVAARDTGLMDHGAFFECRVVEQWLTAPAGTVTIESSPSDANRVMRDMQKMLAENGQKPKWRPDWTGTELRVMASVSKASADPAPMLNLVIRRP